MLPGAGRSLIQTGTLVPPGARHSTSQTGTLVPPGAGHSTSQTGTLLLPGAGHCGQSPSQAGIALYCSLSRQGYTSSSRLIQ